MLELPLGLRTAMESGNCVLFLGSGLGEHIRDAEGNPAPDRVTLARELAEEFSIDTSSEPNLSQVASVIELRRGRPDLKAFLQKRLAGLIPDETLQWLFSIRWSAIFTTNYDEVIERAYELISHPPQNPIPISLAPQFVQHDPRFEVPVYHLHGRLFGAGNQHILITEDDYAKFREPRRMIFDVLKSEFASAPVLYIGYSNKDSNWNTLILELTAEFYPKDMPQSYRISPHTDSIEEEILRSKNVITIDSTLLEFVEVASSIVTGATQDSGRYVELRNKVPPDLLTHFDKSPAPTARLLSSWDYVTQAIFHEIPNIQPFLHGNRPNWSLVGARKVFERDLEEEVYEKLLDFATSSASNPRVAIILGSAGYGTTTLLMTIAARLVNDKAGPVFMLRPGNRVVEGDIEFAVSLFQERSFFFIDNAADYADSIHTILNQLKNTEQPTFLVLGARLNEWRQSHGRLNVYEHMIEPLSDPEIDRLIDLLEENSAQGVLSNLSREMQFSAIKKQHGKELLVTLREVTEGKSFDAILESEYRGIGPSAARDLYLAVCCFHQHGVYIRDKLLGSILDTDLIELYEQTNESTEGIIYYDNINWTHEAYAARTRHRIIAKVVWERCASPDERDSLLRRSLSKLNLNYGLDKTAFDEFVRSDHTIDQIRTLDGKIRFFETAAKKDPDSPYVKQHYARMLLRERKYDLALSQVELAISLSPRTRVLYHTRGMILKALALSAESPEIARRRLVQSEDSFRHGLNLYERDEYSYQGLAQLYREWAEKAPTVEESADYITKAEGVVNEGLKRVKVRSSLWIESSLIQAYLGDQPSRLRALEQAVRDSPGSVIARYLLGRAYRSAGRIEDSLSILKPVVQDHHEEFRCFVEYALALSHLQESYDEAIAILQRSTLYGLSDPRYIATLGGMLIMTGQISEGKKVFEETFRQDFKGDEMNKIQFRPWNFSDDSSPLRLEGTVIVRKAGYALVESEGFPPFLTPGRKFGGLSMEPNQKVSFIPAFCAKGSLAVSPESVE